MCRCGYGASVGNKVDQAALAGAAVAGVIAISASEGRYEPFESIVGIVLAILLLSYRRVSEGERSDDGWPGALSWAAVGSLVLCLIASFPVDQAVDAIMAGGGNLSLATSWALSGLWLIWFTVGLAILHPSSRAVQGDTERPGTGENYDSSSTSYGSSTSA